MNKPLTLDERAELEQLRNALPAVQASVADLQAALDNLAILKRAEVLSEAGIAVSLKALRDQVLRTIDLMDCGRITEARKTLVAMLVLEGKNG